MAIFRLAPASRGIMAAALIADLDDQATPWYGEVYAGAMPASSAVAIGAQVKLGTVTGSADPSATQTGGLITFNPIAEDSAADATGTAAFMRIFKGDDSVWADMDLGDLASSASGKLNTVSIVAGGPIRVNAFTIAVG